MNNIMVKSGVGGNGRNSYSNEGLAKEILEDEFQELSSFFLNIFEMCLQEKMNCKSNKKSLYFVAFITRRCHVLFLIFWNIFCSYMYVPDEERPEYLKGCDIKQMESVVKEHFVTDADILSMGGKFADYYVNTRELPRIIVVDEMLLHGRALNQFLLKLEDSIRNWLKEKYELDDVDSYVVKEKLASAVSLEIYAQNNETILLFSRYQKNLHVSQLCNGKEWRSFSKKIALLVSVSEVNNVAYSWSLRMQNRFLWDMQWEDNREFVRVKTDLQNIRQDNYIWLYPDANAPKAVCTVRVKESFTKGTDGKKLLLSVPFIIMGKRSYKSALHLHEVLVQELKDQPFVKMLSSRDEYIRNYHQAEYYFRWISETNELILSYMMFKLFLQTLPEVTKRELENKDVKEYVDFLQIARNFLYFYEDVDGGTYSYDMEELLSAVWDWEFEEDDFKRYLDLAINDAEELYNSADQKVVIGREDEEQGFCKKGIIYSIENITAGIGIEAERNAHERCSSGVTFSEETLSSWGNYYSLRDILQRYFENMEKNSTVDIYQVLAVLVQEMDLGILGMNAHYDGEHLFTAVRAGEQSLFIKPVRYRDYITVLSKIKSRYGNNRTDIQLDIQRFAEQILKTNPELDKKIFGADMLYQFLEGLWYSGQSLEDWDFFQYDVIDKVNPRDNSEVSMVDCVFEGVMNQVKYMSIYNGL